MLEEEEEEEEGEKREVSRGNVNVNGDEDNEEVSSMNFHTCPSFLYLFIHEIKDIIWIGPTLRFGQSWPKYFQVIFGKFMF